MGSANVTSFNENLSDQDLKVLCGSQYEPNMFTTLQNPATGYVSKDFFFQLLSSSSSSSIGVEREVYYLYLQYCPNGEMDLKLFLKFCVETKTLKKLLFTKGEAELLFQKYKSKYGLKKSINYFIFRHDLLPSIAMKRQWNIMNYLLKLSKCKEPTGGIQEIKKGEGNGDHEITTARSTGSSSNAPQKECISLFAASDEQITAAVVKLQSFHRKTQAKIDLAALREVISSLLSLLSDSSSSSPPPPPLLSQLEHLSHQEEEHHIIPLELDPSTNLTLSNIFLQNSPDITSNEMNLQSFLQFCSNYSLYLPRLCTTNDCKIIFQTTLAIGKHSEQINQFISYDKRIQFIAFRDILLPLLATKRHQTVTELIEIILTRQSTQQR
jgi:hypothetical protein